ncbi:MAG: MOSC domain-containing protein [Pikeienuella sp.]
MPILSPTDHYATVAYLGVVAPDSGVRSGGLSSMNLTWDGAEGESHAGRTRSSCVRVKRQHAEGTEIFNARQLSVLSVEELAEVATAMDIDHIKPEWTGASIVLEGIPEFTKIPPASRLVFENGAAIISDMENAPCEFIAREIEAEYPGKGKTFPYHARNKRGVCGWVERPGQITLGMKCRLHIPPQRIWTHA